MGWAGPGPGPLTHTLRPRPLQLCVVLNDVELVRKAARQALGGLAWPEGAEGTEGGLPRSLLSCMSALDDDLQRDAHTVTAHLTSKVGRGGLAWGPGVGAAPGRAKCCLSHQMVSDTQKYVQHISLSPDSIQNEEVRGLDQEPGDNGRAGSGWGPGRRCPGDSHRLWLRSSSTWTRSWPC